MGSSDGPVWVVDESLCSTAIDRARHAVSAPDAVDNLVLYYDREGGYAGSTFSDLAPNDPLSIGAADLLAVTTLSVRVPPAAIRGFLDDDNAHRASELLAALPTSARLENEGSSELADQMAEFHNFAKRTLGSNPWVTASKLCARKRPHLFPVRDREVLAFLGLTPGYATNWPAFAAIMRDNLVRDQLDRVVREATSRGAHLGDGTPALRRLDVVLWMAATRGLAVPRAGTGSAAPQPSR
ncbi:DUF6308 family protein [Arsenicicoccus sp. oral taxon 190]|uniref:DUF6308 family protein n=1 Tax=Arsenicicoccus sp. oral taxon 190 TaxID=1658671 RepID=UPI00067BF591|nr:DUF6308 family protein [Arsenicicoccus sp. oral taxon 190]